MLMTTATPTGFYACVLVTARECVKLYEYYERYEKGPDAAKMQGYGFTGRAIAEICQRALSAGIHQPGDMTAAIGNFYESRPRRVNQ